MHGGKVDLLSSSGVYQLRQSWEGRWEESRGEESEEARMKATDCQIAVWQSSVASGTVTTATTVSVVVAVRRRQDREKQRKTGEGWHKENSAGDPKNSKKKLIVYPIKAEMLSLFIFISNTGQIIEEKFSQIHSYLKRTFKPTNVHLRPSLSFKTKHRMCDVHPLFFVSFDTGLLLILSVVFWFNQNSKLRTLCFVQLTVWVIFTL